MMGALKGLDSGWPWWASLLVAFAWAVFYICRLIARYRLLSKALDKVTPEQVPEVAAFINGDRVGQRRRETAHRELPPGAGDAGV